MAMEIRLAFAEAMQDGRAVSKVGVVMPPEAAAVIAMVLFQQVRIYEENSARFVTPSWKAMKAGQSFNLNQTMGTLANLPENSAHHRAHGRNNRSLSLHCDQCRIWTLSKSAPSDGVKKLADLTNN